MHSRLTPESVAEGHREADAVVEVFEEYQEALDGLDGFSHLFVIGYFHRLRPEQIGPLKVRPKRLLKYGLRLEELPVLGVLALDSPTRPNPIGLTLVHLAKRVGRNLSVEGLDYFDGTPVLDIKPYQPQYRTEEFSVPRWYSRLHERAGRV